MMEEKNTAAPSVFTGNHASWGGSLREKPATPGGRFYFFRLNLVLDADGSGGVRGEFSFLREDGTLNGVERVVGAWEAGTRELELRGFENTSGGPLDSYRLRVADDGRGTLTGFARGRGEWADPLVGLPLAG